MIVLGGMGSITGAVLGAMVITIVPEVLRMLPGGVYSYRLVIYSALLIVIMLTRPQGILGTTSLAFMAEATRNAPEGDKAVGETGVPIAQQHSSTKKSEQE